MTLKELMIENAKDQDLEKMIKRAHIETITIHPKNISIKDLAPIVAMRHPQESLEIMRLKK